MIERQAFLALSSLLLPPRGIAPRVVSTIYSLELSASGGLLRAGLRAEGGRGVSRKGFGVACGVVIPPPPRARPRARYFHPLGEKESRRR